MDQTLHGYTSGHYGPRAEAYVTSAVHAEGEDLAQIEEVLRGRDLARVLDLGCGGGHVSYRAAPHVGEVVACDITAAMLEAVSRTARERGLTNVRVQQAPAEALPFGAGDFDAVLCRFTTHHWPDMEAGLREARRVLKPDAPAVFIDVLAARNAVLDTHLQAVELLRDPSHVRDYTQAEWLAALSRVGFAIESITMRRLRMEFPVWIARTRTPDVEAAAIRALQRGAPADVQRHFAIDQDGSFDIEVATMVVRAA